MQIAEFSGENLLISFWLESRNIEINYEKHKICFSKFLFPHAQKATFVAIHFNHWINVWQTKNISHKSVIQSIIQSISHQRMHFTLWEMSASSRLSTALLEGAQSRIGRCRFRLPVANSQDPPCWLALLAWNVTRKIDSSAMAKLHKFLQKI